MRSIAHPTPPASPPQPRAEPAGSRALFLRSPTKQPGPGPTVRRSPRQHVEQPLPHEPSVGLRHSSHRRTNQRYPTPPRSSDADAEAVTTDTTRRAPLHTVAPLHYCRAAWTTGSDAAGPAATRSTHATRPSHARSVRWQSPAWPASYAARRCRSSSWLADLSVCDLCSEIGQRTRAWWAKRKWHGVMARLASQPLCIPV